MSSGIRALTEDLCRTAQRHGPVEVRDSDKLSMLRKRVSLKWRVPREVPGRGDDAVREQSLHVSVWTELLSHAFGQVASMLKVRLLAPGRPSCDASDTYR